MSRVEFSSFLINPVSDADLDKFETILLWDPSILTIEMSVAQVITASVVIDVALGRRSSTETARVRAQQILKAAYSYVD